MSKTDRLGLLECLAHVVDSKRIYVPEIIGAGICDGCGQHVERLAVFSGAPVANICMCEKCVPTAFPTTKQA